MFICRPTLGSLFAEGVESVCRKHGRKKHSYDVISFLITAKIRIVSHLPQTTRHMTHEVLAATECSWDLYDFDNNIIKIKKKSMYVIT